jgi:UDP-glucose 4-epimerase
MMSSTTNRGRTHGPPQRVLVTGGAGYIGSHLVDRLLSDGHQVTVLDNLSTGTARRLDNQIASGQARLVRGSVLDWRLASAEVAKASLVFHLAAAVGVQRVVSDPLRALQTNVAGTENILRACADHGSAFVLASSSEVYGKAASVPMSESGDTVLGPTTVPRWSYAAAKAVDEHLALAYGGSGLRVSIVRYFNCYGPRLDRAGDASVIGVFLRRALAGEPLVLHGDGRQTRCFTYVSDTVEGTVLAAYEPRAQGRVFNLGSCAETSIARLAELIVAATGSRSAIQRTQYETVFGPAFEDVRRRVPDITQAREVLGWEPQIGLEEGIKRTIAWWEDDHD